MLHITIPGAPTTKKNHSQIIKTKGTGKPILIPSKQYLAYTKHCATYLQGLPTDAMPPPPYNIRALYYMPTRRRVDLTNLLAATDDILVHYGLITDDNSSIVGGHDGSRVHYDKANPRVELYIEPLAVSDNT